MRKITRHFSMATLILAVLNSLAFAQAWPEKPIRLILPYAPGGVPEAIFRTLSPGLEVRLGQRFIVEARPGGDGAIGGGAVARATPDGYTLIIAGTGLMSVTSHINKNLGFDPLGAFDVIATLAEAPPLAIVHPSMPVRNLDELVSYLLANPGKFNYGAQNSGSPTHLTGAALSQMTGNSMVYIAYKGTAPLVQAMLANDIQVAFPTLSGIGPHIKAGKLRALAVMARQRMAELPDVPSALEAGFAQLVGTNWWAMSAPRGTPPAIIERLSSEVRLGLGEDEVRKRLAALGHSPLVMTHAESAAFVRSESARYKEIVEKGRISLQ